MPGGLCSCESADETAKNQSQPFGRYREEKANPLTPCGSPEPANRALHLLFSRPEAARFESSWLG
jgi:hypothetical protein